MKREFLLSCFWGTALGTVLSFGGVGCLITAFDLDAGNMVRLLLLCLTFSMAGAVCFRLKWGGAILLSGLALMAGFLWRKGEALDQTLGVIETISRVYDNAYHWGYLATQGSDGAFFPMTALAALIGLTVGRTVSKGSSIWGAMLVALLPLLLCLVVTDTVPEEAFLFILLMGMGILILTASVRHKSPEQGNLLTAMVAAPVVLALAILFLLNPQENYVNRNFDFQQTALQYLEQLPEKLTDLPQLWEEITDGGQLEPPEDQLRDVDLRDVGPQDEKTYKVMEVFGTISGTVYLRGQDFDLYSGTNWQNSAQPGEVFPRNSGALRSVGAVTIETTRLRDVLYLPYYPTKAFSLLSGRAYNLQGVKRYAITVGALTEDWRSQSLGAPGLELTAAQNRGETKAQERYTDLPAVTRRGAQALLEDILGADLTRTQQADAIAAYVRGSAAYDLNTPAMPAGEADFALWFLESSDTGYCVHFATATTVLLRAAGIPARYVTGYMTPLTSGETVTVTAAQAHAWVEYYEPALDVWIMLESTPAAETREPDPSQAQTEPGTTEQTESTEGTTEGLDTRPEETETTPEPTQTQTPTEPESQPPRKIVLPGWVKGLFVTVLILAGLVLAAQLQRQIRLLRKRRALRSGKPNELALKRWREAVLLARLAGEGRPPRALEKLAQKAKYSQHTLTGEELEELETYLEDCRALLLARPWYWQLLCRYLYVVY